MTIRSFLDLDVYKESLQLAKEIHYLLKSFPKSEQFLLVDQMNRASRAVPSLIAEGWSKRNTLKEFKKYLRDAIGESNEMMNHLTQAQIFNYLKKEEAENLIRRYDILAGKLTRLGEKWQNFS